MGNQEVLSVTGDDDLTRLEQGVDSWNCWRESNPDLKPNLSRAYLFEADLRGINFRDVVLSRACLIGANLQGADLERADLSGVYATGANFSDANLKAADLSQANLGEANFKAANLSKAQVNATNFAAAQLTGACLAGWQMKEMPQLEAVVCQFICLQDPPGDRYPQDGELPPGKLQQLMREQPGLFALDPTELVEESVSTASSSLDSTVSSQPTEIPPVAFTPTVTPSGATHDGFQDNQRLLRLIEQQAWGWKILLGLGLLALLGAIAFLTNRTSAPTPTAATVTEPPSLASLPCNELPPPALPDRAPDYEYENGTQYYGTVMGGMPADGRGIMVFSSGDRYDGEFRNGERNGCGTFTFASGRRYMGEFRNDAFNGEGIWILENGDRYIGEFEDSKCSGQGTFIFADGSSESGIWQNSLLVDGNLSCSRGKINQPNSTAQ